AQRAEEAQRDLADEREDAVRERAAGVGRLADVHEEGMQPGILIATARRVFGKFRQELEQLAVRAAEALGRLLIRQQAFEQQRAGGVELPDALADDLVGLAPEAAADRRDGGLDRRGVLDSPVAAERQRGLAARLADLGKAVQRRVVVRGALGLGLEAGGRR